MSPWCCILLTIFNRVINMNIYFFVWVVSHACKQNGAIIAILWSLYKSVSALYCNYHYWVLIDLIYIYTYYLLYISLQYTIKNSTRRSFGIVVHYFKRYVLYIVIITIMVLFVSPIFILMTYYWVSVLKFIYITKNKKQHSRGIIWHTGWKHCTLEWFEVQSNCWERD